MLMDILATDNMASYNVKIAQVMGLHTAIYLNELINISSKATKKEKLVGGRFFILDRKYIEKRTTIEEQEQLVIDTKLCQSNIMFKPEGALDSIYLDINKLAEMISSDDEQYLEKVRKKTRVKTAALPGMKTTMMQRKAEELKVYIAPTIPELDSAFSDWLDSVAVNPKCTGLTKAKVTLFQKAIHEFANGHPEVAIEVVNIATIHGYLDAEWAINAFKKAHPNNSGFVSTTRKRAVLDNSEVF